MNVIRAATCSYPARLTAVIPTIMRHDFYTTQQGVGSLRHGQTCDPQRVGKKINGLLKLDSVIDLNLLFVCCERKLKGSEEEAPCLPPSSSE